MTGWASDWQAKQARKIKLSPAQLCPCRSGWVIASCCLDETDGRLRKSVPSLQPPGSVTNFSHLGCYLGITNNCSEDISREHYISETVLEQIAASENAVSISGLPFLAIGEEKALPIGSLVSKILCQRHNSALSPLDQEAGLFFKLLADAMMRVPRGISSSRRPDLWLGSGTALELWMLKVACGLYFSRMGASEQDRICDTHSINMDKVVGAFFSGKWEQRAGLYFSGSTGTVITTAYHVRAAPLIDNALMFMAGVRISLLGFECELVFDTAGTKPEPWVGVIYRPNELVFERETGPNKHILLSWPKSVPEVSIHFRVRSN
jgi:hypothetical protein